MQGEFVDAVIGAMASSEDLSTQILNNSEISQKLMGELVPIIYKALSVDGVIERLHLDRREMASDDAAILSAMRSTSAAAPWLLL